MLIIVSRTRPAQYAYLKHAFTPDAIEVILDRRAETRRQGQETTIGVEQRRRERRRRDITDDLEHFGWAVVRR